MSYKLLHDRVITALRWGSLAVSTLVISVGLPLLAEASNKTLYRYVNDKGIKVINFTVPPRYVKNGYEVLNLHGQVIRTVGRQKTQAELAAAEKVRQQQAAERDLQRRYSSSQEVMDAKKRRLSELTDQIRLAQSSIALLTNQLNKERIKAAQKERQGLPVSEAITVNIANFKEKREESRRRVARLKQNWSDVEAMFDKNIALYDSIEDRRNRRSSTNVQGLNSERTVSN